MPSHKTSRPMEARARTASRSLAERRLAWADICGKVQYDGLADTAASQDLCRVVFATLRDYHDKPSQRAVERAIAVALSTSGDFLKAFAGLVVKGGDRADTLGASQRLVLTRWSCLLMDHLDATEHAGAFARIAQTQGALVAASALATCSETPSPCSPFQQLLRRKPSLVDAYLAQLGEGSKAMAATAPVAACGLAVELLHHATAASSPEEVAAKVRAVAMDAYTRVPLGGDAKAKLPPHIASLFHGLVRTMTATEFAQTAVAQATKQLRRSPEAVLPSVARMLASASVANLDGADGAAMEALRDCVLAQVKHADERRRAAAVGCVGAVAAAGAGIAAKSYFDAIVSELEKKPKEWQARAGLCAALGALAKLRTDSEKAIGSMAVEACARLAASLRSEAQRDAKESATDALGDWLAHLPGPLTKDVADVCAAGIKDGKDGHGKRVLRVLVSAFIREPGFSRGRRRRVAGEGRI